MHRHWPTVEPCLHHHARETFVPAWLHENGAVSEEAGLVFLVHKTEIDYGTIGSIQLDRTVPGQEQF